MNYDELEKELQQIIQKLESGELEFEEASKIFERGSEISEILSQRLKTEMGKVSVLREKLNSLTEEPFEQ